MHTFLPLQFELRSQLMLAIYTRALGLTDSARERRLLSTAFTSQAAVSLVLVARRRP